jgi:CRP-like cAMP-binding protein
MFQAGEVVFEEGEAGDRAFLVQKGAVEIVQKRPSGDAVLRRVEAGEVFGAMSAIDEQPRVATARAAEDSVCIVIPKPVFEQKIAASDPFIAALLRWFVSQSRGRSTH